MRDTTAVKYELLNCYKNAITIPERLTLPEWCKRNVYLPNPPYNIAGYFDVTKTPYLKEPLEALGDNVTREIIFCGNPRCGKTLLAEAYMLATLARDPADIWFAMHKDNSIKTFVDVRIRPLLDANAKLLNWSDNRYDQSQQSIKFEVGSVKFVGAKTPSAMTQTAGRVLIGDEVWQWTTGVLEQFKKRADDFPYSKKILLISQASDEGTDFHLEYLRGHQARWGFKCPHCETVQPFVFYNEDNEGNYSGLCWERNDTTYIDGIWDIEEAAKTAHYKCCKCKHDFHDTPKERRLLNDCGLYISTNPKAGVDIKSYSVNAIATPHISFAELAKEYLTADHQANFLKYESKKNFFLQRMSQFWSARFAQNELRPLVADDGDTPASGSIGGVNLLTVDVQYSGFMPYTICRHNKDDKTITLVKYGKATTYDEIAALAVDNNVLPHRVLIDSGHDTTMVYNEVIKHRVDKDGKQYTWLTTHGTTAKQYYWGKDKAGQSIYKAYSINKPTFIHYGQKGKLKERVNHILFYPNAIKDELKPLLDNKHPQWKLYLSEEATKDRDFMDQLNAEKKVPDIDKSGHTNWVWKKVSQSATNDFFDCLVLQVLAAKMMDYL